MPPAPPCGSPRPRAGARRGPRQAAETGLLGPGFERGSRRRRRAGPGRARSPSHPTDVSSSVRRAIKPRASSSLAPDNNSLRISAEASNHRCRNRLCSNRSALCTAIPAAAARASTRTSSSAVNSACPPSRTVLLGEVQVAEHRVTHPDRDTEEGPHRRMMRRETDRRLVPAEVGQPQRVLTEDRAGRAAPCPREAGPSSPASARRARCRQTARYRPVGPSTPNAPYRASTRSTAACTMRRRVASSSRPDATARTASSRPCIRPRVATTSASRSCTSRSSASGRRPDCTSGITSDDGSSTAGSGSPGSRRAKPPGAAPCSSSGTSIPCPAAGPLLPPANSGSAWHDRRPRTTSRLTTAPPTTMEVQGGSTRDFRP